MNFKKTKKTFLSTRYFLLAGMLTIAAMLGNLPITTANAVVPGTNKLVNYNAAGMPVPIGNVVRVSEDGNTVAWISQNHGLYASDPFPTSSAEVIYKRNMQTGVTSYATPLNTSGTPISIDGLNFAMSRSGRYFVYSLASYQSVVSSPAIPYSGIKHVYWTDTQTGITKLVDQSIAGVPANDDSVGYPAFNVSDDGRFVLFTSYAKNLLSTGNPTAPEVNFYVKDMQTGQVINPTLSNSGVRGNGVRSSMVSSCDGSIMAFSANSTNLTPQDTGAGDVYLVDIRGGYFIKNISYVANKSMKVLAMSCNGRYLELSTKSTNLTTDVVSGTVDHYYRYDRLSETYELIDKSTSGYVSTLSPNANGLGTSRVISDDGKVIFASNDHAMVSPASLKNNEIYLRNPEMGTTELVPINNSNVEQNAVSGNLMLEMNSKGTAVLYTTTATNLIPGITAAYQQLVLSKVE